MPGSYLKVHLAEFERRPVDPAWRRIYVEIAYGHIGRATFGEFFRKNAVPEGFRRL